MRNRISFFKRRYKLVDIHPIFPAPTTKQVKASDSSDPAAVSVIFRHKASNLALVTYRLLAIEEQQPPITDEFLKYTSSLVGLFIRHKINITSLGQFDWDLYLFTSHDVSRLDHIFHLIHGTPAIVMRKVVEEQYRREYHQDIPNAYASSDVLFIMHHLLHILFYKSVYPEGTLFIEEEA